MTSHWEFPVSPGRLRFGTPPVDAEIIDVESVEVGDDKDEEI
jgi:hypothetical protein